MFVRKISRQAPTKGSRIDRAEAIAELIAQTELFSDLL
jgi:hypothetical protein